MATTPTPSVADTGKKGQRPTTAANEALAKWRASLTPEAKAEMAERIRETQRQRWLNMSERERRDALAGVKAWQRAQRDAKRAKAKTPPKASAKAEAPVAPSAAPQPERVIEVTGPDGTSTPSEANNLLANPIFKRQSRRGRKAVSK